MKTIIRIEHEDGWGMFRPPRNEDGSFTRVHLSNICPDASNRHDDFNTPSQDGYCITDDDFCAYKSIDQLQHWITKDELGVLFEHSFKVFLIDVSDCYEGEDQMIYKKENIVLKKDISDLFK